MEYERDIKEEIEEIVIRLRRLQDGCKGVRCRECPLFDAEEGTAEHEICNQLEELGRDY